MKPPLKPDVLGDEHPVQFAVIDGVYPDAPLEAQPVVTGTFGHFDSHVIAWALDEPERACLSSDAVARLLMPHVTGTRTAVVRFRWCPSCAEWSPCKVRREAGGEL